MQHWNSTFFLLSDFLLSSSAYKMRKVKWWDKIVRLISISKLIHFDVVVLLLSGSVMSDSLWPRGLEPAMLFCPWGFSRQEYWSGLLCPPPGKLPIPGIKPRAPLLQADSLWSELPGNHKNTRVSSLSFLQGIFLTQESNWGLLHCRWILYQGSPSSGS